MAIEIDSERVIARVVSAYMVAVGRPAYFRMKIKPGSKTADSALQMAALAEWAKTPLDQVMKTAIGMYGSDWCQQTFHKDHPPFAVVVSDKCRRRLVKKFSERALMTDGDITNQAREVAANLVAMVGKERALWTVDTGWPTEKRLRDEVKKILEGK